MALVKIINKSYTTKNDVAALLNYVLNPTKMDSNIYNFNLLYPYAGIQSLAQQIIDISDYYGKAYGTLVKHYIISYPYLEGPITKDIVCRAMRNLTRFVFDGYPCAYAMHDAGPHPHFHLVVGATNLYTGQKLNDNKTLHAAMADTMQTFTYYNDKNNQRTCHIKYDIVYSNSR